ncbi:MAG: SRPBCC domain-containing protein [Gemmatimonadaceae bacterium]
MPIYQTTFDINASAATVWQVLTTLDQYGEWNPQVPRASGAIAEGGTIHLTLALPGRPAMNLAATIEEVRPRELLTWCGHVVAAWFFEGHRKFAIQATAERRVSITHVEDVHGFLAPLFGLLMGGPVERSHHALNDALRTRAENTQGDHAMATARL